MMLLTTVRDIELPENLADADAQAVMAALDAGPQAQAPAARFVGGCVRNVLMDLPPGDIDIATQYRPETVMQRLQDAGIRVIATGIEHGTVTAIGPDTGRPFEITTLRRDVATDGRHADVAFSTDWVEDAKRRDFTMNTLLCDLRGRVYDPLGMGVADLEARHVRFVGDPARRIAEDYLRILRFLRFSAEYGGGEPDSDGLAACHAEADKVYRLARERIAQEFLKILAVAYPVDILEIMRENNILRAVFHSDYNSDTLRILCNLQLEVAQARNVPRLLAVSGCDSTHYAGLEAIMTMPVSYKRFGQNIVEALHKVKALSHYNYRTLIYFYGHDVAADAFMMKAARDALASDVGDIIKRHANWDAPALPLNGDDLQALGVQPGPGLGEILKRVESWWLEQDFAPGRDACLDYVRSVLSSEW